MTGRKRIGGLAVLVVMAGVAMLGGCREDEQDRVIVFEQGTYQGNPDPGLSEAQVDDLRGRAQRQQY